MIQVKVTFTLVSAEFWPGKVGIVTFIAEQRVKTHCDGACRASSELLRLLSCVNGGHTREHLGER